MSFRVLIAFASLVAGTPAFAQEEPAAPAAAPVAEPAAPPPAQVAEPERKATPAPPRSTRKRHPSGMLIAGAVTFFLPYLATVGLAAHYADYNANAARAGYIPLAGPFLARNTINDKDLKDGYDVGLLVDGIVQVVTFNLMLAGIIWCAVGEKEAAPRRDAVTVRPLASFDARGGQLGAMVTW